MREYLVRPGEDVQAVFDRAEPGSLIRFEAGIYRQKLMLRTPGLLLEGAGADETVLLWGDYAKKIHADGKEFNTFRTWTLAVCADGVQMKNLSVVNDALDPDVKGQEVALSVYGDRFSMEGCTLRSTQDTLFVGPLPPDLRKSSTSRPASTDTMLSTSVFSTIPVRYIRSCWVQET